MKSVREKYREQVKLDSTETTFIVLYNCLGLLPLAFALVPSSLAPILLPWYQCRCHCWTETFERYLTKFAH